MSSPIVLQNDVPKLERLLAVFFALVGAPFVYLAWTESEELPELLVPIVQVGLPLFLIVLVWRAFAHRKRVRVTLMPGSPTAEIDERLLFGTRHRSADVVGVSMEMGEDIDGDPYGSLIIVFSDGTDLIAAEGNDIEMLDARLLDVQSWLDRRP